MSTVYVTSLGKIIKEPELLPTNIDPNVWFIHNYSFFPQELRECKGPPSFQQVTPKNIFHILRFCQDSLLYLNGSVYDVGGGELKV